MSISNCSAYSASATTQAITGIVKPAPRETEVPVVTPVAAIKPLTKNDDQPEQKGPPPQASLSSDTLAAILSFAGGA
ncbi:MAG TPA: hypothetical protein VHP58_03200 [Alphaproteobacteria bacterium]|nr:hypothetical protein [Alphaproteobacteria bacterium]